MRRLIAGCTALAMLGACTAPSQPILDSAIANCASGNQQACSQVPSWQSVVSREKQEQAERVGAGLLLVLGAAAAGAAAGLAASAPRTEVYVVCRPYWSC